MDRFLNRFSWLCTWPLMLVVIVVFLGGLIGAAIGDCNGLMLVSLYCYLVFPIVVWGLIDYGFVRRNRTYRARVLIFVAMTVVVFAQSAYYWILVAQAPIRNEYFVYGIITIICLNAFAGLIGISVGARWSAPEAWGKSLTDSGMTKY